MRSTPQNEAAEREALSTPEIPRTPEFFGPEFLGSKQLIGKMALRGPFVIAAGPWSSGQESAAPLRSAGAILVKTVTAVARAGNPPPVVRALPAPSRGFLNWGGLRYAVTSSSALREALCPLSTS